ncbi:MAG: GNAT family N-acetyltransferase [Saprospiraceae bacterium]|nr:GNAT family N-acetyltransferase [Saprospiraceae bacterium]
MYNYQFSDKIGLPWVIKKMPQFLFPDLSKKKDRIQKPFSGVLGSMDRSPIGLVLSTRDQEGTSARIHSLLVHPHYRNQQIAFNMLTLLEKELVKKGVTQIDGYFRSHWKSAEHITSLLKKMQWSAPKEALTIVRGLAVNALRVFSQDKSDLPDGYSFISYDRLQSNEKEWILAQEQEQWYPSHLNPFQNPSTIYAPSSIFLKYENKIVGWVITHLVAPELNEFTSLFIDPSHRTFRIAHRLMHEGIDQQVRTGIKNFMITARTDNKIMSRYVQRHRQTANLLLTRSMHAKKQLSALP